MYRKEENGVHWLEFDLLKNIPKITHAVFLRHGGFSKGSFASLNFGYGSDDDPKNVRANVALAKKILNIETLVSTFQVHGDIVTKVNTDKKAPKDACDGTMTNIPDVALMVGHADCQATIFYDPVNHALANVHAGWRGNVKNIFEKAINGMKQNYGSRPENLLVCISPSLGPERAEFINYKTELPESFWDFQIKPTYFDLWAISRWQLEHCGILPHHIEIAGISTYANPQDFFSYRREKISGRHATIAMLI